jgi:hypothetical protein
MFPQSGPDAVPFPLSDTTIQNLAAHPDLFHLTIPQLDSERQKTTSFTPLPPPSDASPDEERRFEAQKTYIDQRRAAIDYHLLRAYEAEFNDRERDEQRTKELEEEDKKQEEEMVERTELREKSEEELKLRKFYEEDIGELYCERRKARLMGVGNKGRTVEEIDREIGNKLLGIECGGAIEVDTTVKGFEKLKGEVELKPVMVEMGIQNDLTGPDIVPLVESPPIPTPETIIDSAPRLAVEMARPRTAISSLVKPKVVPPCRKIVLTVSLKINRFQLRPSRNRPPRTSNHLHTLHGSHLEQ